MKEKNTKLKFSISIVVITFLSIGGFPTKVSAQDTGANTPTHHHYKLIDLGTFGGPSSYLEIDNGVNGAPNQVLNGGGIAVGWADTSTPDPYAPDCFNFDCFTSYAFQWQNGTTIDLGALPGGQGPDDCPRGAAESDRRQCL